MHQDNKSSDINIIWQDAWQDAWQDVWQNASYIEVRQQILGGYDE